MEDTLLSQLNDTIARLAAAAEAITAAQPAVDRIVAETENDLTARIAALEDKLAAFTTRKTIAAGAASLQSKQPETAAASIDAAAIDAALSSLSIEQRIAVKADLLRTGILA